MFAVTTFTTLSIGSVTSIKLTIGLARYIKCQSTLITSCLGYVYICSLLAGFAYSIVFHLFICHVLRFCVTIASLGFL